MMTPTIDAQIGFNVPDSTFAHVRSTFGFAIDENAATTATIWYRNLTTPGGTVQFVRDDPLRSSEQVWTGDDVGSLIDDLHLTIALHACDQVYIHAGVVIWKDTAILIPGRSRSGKSTLVEALVRAGASYSSDEYAIVQPGGTIAPYQRPIQLRTPHGRRLVDAATIGSVADSPAAAGLVVFTSFSPAAEFEPRVVAPAAAALRLFDNTVIAQVHPDRATAAAAQIARSARCVRTPRADAASIAPRILELAEQTKVTS